MTRNSLTRSLAVLALTAISAAPATAQRQLFTWTGRVDQEIQLTMSGRNLSVSNIGPREPGQRSATILGSVPREEGNVTVTTANGRGTVEVIQQPTATNGFLTTIRIRDPLPGAADYQVTAAWQAAANGDVGPPYGRARGYGRGNMRLPEANRVVLRWSGDVDDNLRIMMRAGGVGYRT